MNSYKDDYEKLGIDENASTDEIKLAYRRLAKKYHPDLNKEDPHTQKKFMEIQKAFENIQKGTKSIPIKRESKSRKSSDFYANSFFNFNEISSFFDTFFRSRDRPNIQKPKTHIDLRKEIKRKRNKSDKDNFSHFDTEFENIIRRFFKEF